MKVFSRNGFITESKYAQLTIHTYMYVVKAKISFFPFFSDFAKMNLQRDVHYYGWREYRLRSNGTLSICVANEEKDAKNDEVRKK